MKRVARLAVTRALAAAGLLAAVVAAAQSSSRTITYRYDANGNLVGKSQSGVEWTYIYDVRDRLVEIRRDGQRVESHRYDHQDRRVSTTDAAGTTTRFLWDGDRLLAEQDASGRTIARYTHAGDRPIAFEHADDGRGAYLLDALGSPVSLSRPDGTLAVRYRYDAWGATEERAGDSPNPIGFTGHLFDGATGHYYARARYYDPELGRFFTADPFGGTAEEPRSHHPYLYAYANPTAYLDRDGRCVGSWLDQSAFCQAIERFFEHQYAGDPLAIADRDVAVHQLVMDGRSRFREDHGREPLPDDVVATVGSTQFTAGFEEIDTSGRIEADHLEWSLATVGVGGRVAYAGARAGGAATSAALAAGARQAADEAVSEVLVVSPGDLARFPRRGSRLSSSSGQAGPTGIIGESSDGGIRIDHWSESPELADLVPEVPAAKAARWVDEGGNLRAGRGPGNVGEGLRLTVRCSGCEIQRALRTKSSACARLQRRRQSAPVREVRWHRRRTADRPQDCSAYRSEDQRARAAPVRSPAPAWTLWRLGASYCCRGESRKAALRGRGDNQHRGQSHTAMTSKLVEIIAHFAIFLEFADGSVVELEAAVKQQEDLAFRLQQLSPSERAEFARTLAEIASGMPQPEHRKYLEALPHAVGIA